MQTDNNPKPPTRQEPTSPLGNVALKVYLAVALKAGKSEEAHKPAGGWAAYAGVRDRSVRHALSEICDAGLAVRSGGAVILDREGWDWTDEDVPHYVRVPGEIKSLPPELVRAWLALLSLADFRTGAGAATETTIGRRMSRSRCRASVLLDRLGERGLWRRTGKRTWLVAKHRPKSEPFAMVPHFILATAFGFDFRTRAEVENSADPAEFEPTAEDENSENDSEYLIRASRYSPVRKNCPTARGDRLRREKRQGTNTPTGKGRTPSGKGRTKSGKGRTHIKNHQEPLSRTVRVQSARCANGGRLPSGLVAGMFGGAA